MSVNGPVTESRIEEIRKAVAEEISSQGSQQIWAQRCADVLIVSDAECCASVLELAHWRARVDDLQRDCTRHETRAREASAPVALILSCPVCHARHYDEGEFATRHHHTHACQSCGVCWRPAIVATVGVRFLPGFKNGTP